MITKPFDADARSDVFSLGRIAIFILDAANYHFPSLMSDSFSYIENLNCSTWLKSFLRRSVAEQPILRIQTAAEFSRELGELISTKRIRPMKQIRKERPTFEPQPVQFMEQKRPLTVSLADVDDAT
jgi:serine/threonine protein kinase